jgi:hypothetical protein
MPIVVENVEVIPEPAAASQAGQSNPPPPASQPKPAEIEKILRRLMERLARLQAS